MNKQEKKIKIAKIVDELKKIYPDAICSLNYEGKAWKLLIMGMLSAQCTDKRVNEVCEVLFKEYPSPEKIADAPIERLEEIIMPCGLFHTKAKNVKLSCIRLINDYQGNLPDTMEELLKFEGVGRKVANLLLGDIFKKSAIVADTHCMRICARFGMYKEGKKDPNMTEKIMKELVEPKEQSDLCHRLVLFGRDFCTAKNPKCDICPIKDICKE